MEKNLPKEVILTEVGPRDGFQRESTFIPTEMKRRIIRRLAEAGIREIQAVSFVHPEKLPQMADAEEVIKELELPEHASVTALTLNRRGMERALVAGMKTIEVSLSACPVHSLKNTGLHEDEVLKEGKKMIQDALSQRADVILGIQCAFGSPYKEEIIEEKIADMVFALSEEAGRNCAGISLCDTTGTATPFSISRLILLIKKNDTDNMGDIRLHLHDTRGVGLVNLMTGLQLGISRFDTAFGGMGGCPFIPAAAGNIPTEDTAYLLHSLGIQTGIRLPEVAECSHEMSRFLQKTFSGKMYRLY